MILQYLPQAPFVPFKLHKMTSLFLSMAKRFNRIKCMHKDVLKPLGEGYVEPTNEDIIEFKEWTGWTSKDLAHLTNMAAKHFSEYMNERAYIKGKRIPYASWRFFLEAFGFVDPVIVNIRPFNVRPEIFSAKENWLQPTGREFKQIVDRSGLTKNGLAKLLELPINLVESSLTSKTENPVPISRDKWFVLLGKMNVTGVTDFDLPRLPDRCLLECTDPQYLPPMPVQLRAFIGWTGRSVEEIASLLGMRESNLRFYCSNKSYNDQRAKSNELPPALFSRDGWLQPFARELKMFSGAVGLSLAQLARKLNVDEGFLKKAFASATSQRIFIEQQKWFELLDELKILSANDFHQRFMPATQKNASNQSEAFTPIPYVPWRLLLQRFGVVKPVSCKRKELN